MSDTGCLWARGDMGEHSDLDVLVIVPDGVHRRKTAQTIYRGLRGLGFAVDIVDAIPSDIRDYGWNPSLILYPAFRRGRKSTMPRDREIPGSLEWLLRARIDLAFRQAETVVARAEKKIPKK
jgi:hypothetical protein